MDSMCGPSSLGVSGGARYALHLGDCRDVLSGYAADHFDVTVTDLPYAEETHAGARTLAGHKAANGKTGGVDLVDFASIDFATCRAILSAAARVTRRWVVSTLDWRHCARLADEPPDGLRFVRFGVWTKPNATPQLTGDRPSQGWEAVAILHCEGSRMRWNGGGRRSVWECMAATGRGQYPTQKPIELARSFVTLFGEGGPVLDPCCGSGTVGVACVERGIEYVGIDLRAEAISRARQRIEDAARQGDLFGGAS